MRYEAGMAVLSPNSEDVTAARSEDRPLFDLAFALAYCIHVNKDVAFFVAEDALDGLSTMLGRQEKHRKPIEQLRGFFKWGERSRPIRKTVRLNELQMLQWLVYKQSEFWERQTEQGEGPYLPTEEDLIVRYIEYLIFLTVRRDSFYVALAVGSLLHQFGRRETRLFYDILTQSDSARMKDTNYVGKQRLKMLEKVSRRFGEMVQTIKAPGDEKQLLMRPTTQWVINLVNECLRRFAPWGTTCIVQPGFDVTDIPGLYFSDENPGDEERIAMNRVHTVLHPECLIRFTEGLSKYVRTLPEKDPDRRCKYDSLDERLAVPQFSNFPSGPERGDRFQSPKLAGEDYIRLQRTLDARSHRRKSFVPQKLCVYVDDELICSFHPGTESHIRSSVSLETAVIEVRGEDETGELTLATLLLASGELLGTRFTDSIAHSRGQRLTVRMTPVQDIDGRVKRSQLEVHYTESSLISVFRLVERMWFGLTGIRKDHRHHQVLADLELGSGHPWLARAGVAIALLVLALIWWQFLLPKSRQDIKKPLERAAQPQGTRQVEEKMPVEPATPSPRPKESRASRDENLLVARAAWSVDREATLRAKPVETTRAETEVIDVSHRESKVILSLPRYDNEGHLYSHYRLSLASEETKLWQQTLRSPKKSQTNYAHTLDLVLFAQRFSRKGPYDLRVEGKSQSGWRPLGHLTLSPKEQ